MSDKCQDCGSIAKSGNPVIYSGLFRKYLCSSCLATETDLELYGE
jgi:hypothetical protein